MLTPLIKTVKEAERVIVIVIAIKGQTMGSLGVGGREAMVGRISEVAANFISWPGSL